jgi:hypothetical protein
VRDLNRLELAGESVRACLEALAATAPDWLAEAIDVPEWSARYGVRVDSWRLPGSQAKRDALAAAYGTDGFTLLHAVYAADTPGWLAQLPAVDVLRRVLVQNYVVVVDRRGREVIRRREADVNGLPPGKRRLTSPYDTDARRGGKRDMFWTGYKVHVSETCTGEHEAVADAEDTTQHHHQRCHHRRVCTRRGDDLPDPRGPGPAGPAARGAPVGGRGQRLGHWPEDLHRSRQCRRHSASHSWRPGPGHD